MVGISAERPSAHEVCGTCTGGAREVRGRCMGISAERSSAWEVHGRCAGGGGDKCRKVKCMGGVQQVRGRWVGGHIPIIRGR